MPGRTCSVCLLEHQVVKAYSPRGPYEHIVIQDPATGSYVCELCRTCSCQGCGKSFLAPAAAWRKHLLFSNTAAVEGCRWCPECSSKEHPSQPPRTAAPAYRTAAEIKGVYSRFVQDRGTGPGACAACQALLTIGAQTQQQQQQQEVGQSSRYPTDPLPQQHPWQQHQHGFMQAGGHRVGWECIFPGALYTKGLPAVYAAHHSMAALQMDFRLFPCSSTAARHGSSKALRVASPPTTSSTTSLLFALQGQTTAMSWPSVTASAQAVAALCTGPAHMPAQRVPVAYPTSHPSTTISSNSSTVSESWQDSLPRSQRAQRNPNAPAWQPPQPPTAAAAAEDTSPSAPPMDWPPDSSGPGYGASGVCTVSYPGAGVVHTIRYPQHSTAAAAAVAPAGATLGSAVGPGYVGMGTGGGLGTSSCYDRYGATMPLVGGMQPAGLLSRGAGVAMNTPGLGSRAAVGAGVSPESVQVVEADAGVWKMEGGWKE